MITLVSETDQLPDCIPNHRRYIFFSSKLIRIIQEFGFNDYQTFDIRVVDNSNKEIETNHKLVNILNVVSCIDRENSELQIDEDEEDEDLNIIDIRSLKLDDGNLVRQSIFRLGGFETLLLFREDIARMIVNANCTGLSFVEANGYVV